MTTNQTIDGVPREKLRDVLDRMCRDQLSLGVYGDELRALLDAPADPASSLNRAWQAGYDTGYYAKSPAHERPAAQPQGEPVEPFGYWLQPKGLPLHGMFHRVTENDKVIYEPSNTLERFDAIALYAEQPAPVAVVMPERLQQVLKFLEGAENLDGHWFGEQHPSGRPYWWRNELRKALAETSLFAKQQ